MLQAEVHWAEPRSRFTLLMERLIIDVIQACSTISGACAIMRVSWEEAFGMMERATVVHVADDRKIESLAGYFQGLTAKQRDGIEAVAIGMCPRIEPFAQATLQNLPLAAEKIVCSGGDCFHVLKHMNEAVDPGVRCDGGCTGS